MRLITPPKKYSLAIREQAGSVAADKRGKNEQLAV